MKMKTKVKKLITDTENSGFTDHAFISKTLFFGELQDDENEGSNFL